MSYPNPQLRNQLQNRKLKETKPLLSKDEEDDELELLLEKEKEFHKTYFSFEFPEAIPLLLFTKSKVPKEFLKDFESLSELFADYCKTYKAADLERYKIKLPPTLFQYSQNLLTFTEPRYEAELLSIGSLNGTQLSEIFTTGSFKVHSERFGKDYVWKMNPWIMYGVNNLGKKISLFATKAKDTILKIPDFIYIDPRKSGGQISVYDGLRYLVIPLWNIVDILIGRPRTHIEIKEDQYNSKAIESWNKSLQPLKSKIQLEFLRKWNKIQNDPKGKSTDKSAHHIFNLFETHWNKNLNASTINAANDKFDSEEDAINYVFDKKFKAFSDFLETSLLWTSSEKKALLQFFSMYSILYGIDNEYYEKCSKATDEIKKKVLSQHSYLKRYPCYIDKKIQNAIDEESEFLYCQISQKAIESLANNPNQFILQSFLEFRPKAKSQMAAARKYDMDHPFPNKVFHFTRQLFPPWEVKSRLDYNNKLQYYFQKTVHYTMNSDHFLWRFNYFARRYWDLSWNSMYYLMVSTITGPLGFKALFSLNKFYPEKLVNPDNGTIYTSSRGFHSVISAFGVMCEYIGKRRADFESQPDTGFFGKNFYRVLNLFYCYGVLFLLIGVGGILGIFPAVIISVSSITGVLSLTSFFYSPLLLAIGYLYNVLIHDRISANYSYNTGRQPSTIFPLFTEVFKFLGRGVIQIGASILTMAVILPTVSLVQLLYPYVFCSIRFVLDTLFYIPIRLLGRVPAKDTGIAWRISGPGVARRNTYRISQEHVNVLILSHLEQIELSKFQSEFSQSLRNPINQNRKILEIFMKPFQGSANPSEFVSVENEISKLNSRIDKEIQHRRNILPQFSSSIQVKLTIDELELARKMAKSNIEMFLSQRRLQYIWELKNVEEGSIDKLSDLILAEIFNANFLEPLETMEERVELDIKTSKDFSHFMNLLASQSQDFDKILDTKSHKLRELKSADVDISGLHKKVFNLNSATNKFSQIWNGIINFTEVAFFSRFTSAARLNQRVIDGLDETKA